MLTQDTLEHYIELVEKLGGISSVHEMLGLTYSSLWERCNPRRGRKGKITREMFIAIRALSVISINNEVRGFTRMKLFSMFPNKRSVPGAWLLQRARQLGYKVTSKALNEATRRLIKDGLVERVDRGLYRIKQGETCSVKDCRSKTRARGLCMPHYQTYYEAGMIEVFPKMDDNKTTAPL